MLMHRLGRTTVRLASALALLTLIAGLPTGLVTAIGPPLPHRLPAGWDAWTRLVTGGFPDTAVIDLLAVALWLVWAAFVYTLIGELAATRRGRTAHRLPVVSPMQALAALLIAGLTATPTAAFANTTTSTPVPVVSQVIASPTLPAVASRPATAGTTPASAVPTTAGASTANFAEHDWAGLPRFAAVAHTGPLTVAAGGQHYTVTVQRGDTLWEIAERWLGNPRRWPEIYHLNQHRYDHHGRMRGGNHIEPTWVLVLPDDASPPAEAQPSTPPEQTTPAPPPTAAGIPGGGTPPTSARPPSPAPPSDAPAVVDPDGVDSVPTTSPTAPSSAPTAGSASAPAADPTAPVHRHHPAGIRLPTGSWIELGLAIAITAAAALVWAHRRRRYTPRPPSPDLLLDDPDLAPMPQVVTHVRRGLRRATQPEAAGDDLDGVDSRLEQVNEQQSDGFIGEPESADGKDDDEASGRADGEDRYRRPRPVEPATDSRLSAMWPTDGLGLTGPGAHAAARGFLATALAAGGSDDPHGRSHVVIPSPTVERLLGATPVHLPDTPRLTVTAGMDEALDLLDEQILHRSRLVDQHEVDDVAALRRVDPYEEPLPPIVLIADPATDHERERLAALLSQGQRLDIHAVLLGPWPAGDTVVVADNGATAAAPGGYAADGRQTADLGRLSVLNPAETVDLISTLAGSHTGQPSTLPPKPAASTTPTPSATDRDVVADSWHQPQSAGLTGNHDATAGQAGRTVERRDQDRPVVERAQQTPAAPSIESVSAEANPDRNVTSEHDRASSDHEEKASSGRPVEVSVLGGVRITDLDPSHHLRAKALELLVFLAVHDGAARHDAILDDLMPEAPAAKAPHRLHTYVYSLRKALRDASGSADAFINHTPRQYSLTRDMFDIDLWRMRTALRDAQHATDPDTRITALRRAVDAYHGPLADGFDYEWIDAYRHGIRQQALDAHLALADALHGQPEQQLAVLNAAIHHEPYAEAAYQQAMRAHANLGNLDAIRALRRTLTRHLQEIDAEPSDETLVLADRLASELQRPRRPRPAPSASDGAAA